MIAITKPEHFEDPKTVSVKKIRLSATQKKMMNELDRFGTIRIDERRLSVADTLTDFDLVKQKGPNDLAASPWRIRITLTDRGKEWLRVKR